MNVTEGGSIFADVQAVGFSYGNIPITVTPLGCSDYPGNLGDLFTNIPVNSANPGMWINSICVVLMDNARRENVAIETDVVS